MKSIIMLCIFIGAFLIITGLYEEKLKIAENSKKIEYKFIPRTYYEEQTTNDDLSMKVADLFNYESPWYDRTIGSLKDIPNFKQLSKNVKIA